MTDIAHLLPSAVTIFLRHTLEISDAELRSTCTTKLQDFIHRLEYYQKSENWDIADLCLERCSANVEKATRFCQCPALEYNETGALIGLGSTSDDTIQLDQASNCLSLDMSLEFTWDVAWSGFSS